MTMPKKKRARRAVAGARLDAAGEEWLRGGRPFYYLTLGPFPAPGSDDPSPGDLAKTLWLEHADRVIAEHVAEHPGTRPTRWWDYNAPERRRRIGGVGQPRERGFYFEFGIPDPRAWFRRDDPDWRDVMLSWATPIDAHDPPTFESQATYLRRLGLLLPGEAKRLRPADFEPEAVAVKSPWYRPPVGTKTHMQ